jgi:hypothetical protein
MKARRLVAAGIISALVLSAGASGCGGGAETVTVTDEAPPPSGSVSRSAQKPRVHRSATATVQSYYRAINGFRFSDAWRLLAPSLQNELGGLAAWRDGYRTTVATHASHVELVEQFPGASLVAFDLRSEDIDECGSSVRQDFTGTWTLSSANGRFRATKFDVEKVSGGTPVFDPAECETSEPEPEPVESEEPSACDPNYTGCVPVTGYDVNCPEVGEEVEVVGEDVDGLDLEEDGYACETY